jgi:hypothetical protein
MRERCKNCIRSEDQTWIEYPCVEHEGKICLYCGFEECTASDEMDAILRGMDEKEIKT